MNKEFYHDVFRKVFALQIRQTFTAYLLYKIKTQVKEGMSIKDARYTADGIQALVVDDIDKQEYLLTLTPKKNCIHANTTNLAGVIGCNDCGRILDA